MIAGTLALLIAGSGAVSYERLATPLPELLADVGSMVHKKAVCSPELSEDRLCISVTDVDPRVLLEKIAESCAAKIVEDDSLITLVPDPDYEKDLLAARNAKVDAWHAAWKKELESPVRLRGEQLDIHELAAFVTPDLLRSLPLTGSVSFTRPLVQGTKYLANAVPDYHKRVRNRNTEYVGVEVRVDSKNGSINVWLMFLVKDGSAVVAQNMYVKHWTVLPTSRAPILSVRLTEEETPSRRLAALRDFARISGLGTPVSTRGLDLFATREWGSEPLNAVAAPYLVGAAKITGTDLVCHLDDSAFNTRELDPVAAMLATCTVIENDGWTVAKPLDPRSSRMRQFDRKRLAAFVSTMASSGFADFWRLAQYVTDPRPAPFEALAIEAAAVGPVALLTVTQQSYSAYKDLLLELHQDPAVWATLESGKPIVFSALPRRLQDAFNACMKTNLRFNATSAVTVMRASRNGNQEIVTTSDTRASSPKDLGIDGGLPPAAVITMVRTPQLVLLGRNEKREYMVLSEVNNYAVSVVRAERGDSRPDWDALAILDGFVPMSFVGYYVNIGLGAKTLSGIGVRYLAPVGSTEFAPLDKLRADVRLEIDRRIAEARNSRGGG